MVSTSPIPNAQPDPGVDIKTLEAGHFGNDRTVDANPCDDARSGNDTTIGFIRVRKRNLKRGCSGLPMSSRSFDLVRSVRIDGKPRHRFVLGLGSQKQSVTGRMAAYFLLIANSRMEAQGLNGPQRRSLLTELVRKGARLPTIAECEGWSVDESWKPHVDDLAAWLRIAP
ncbi:hypothetical protein JQ617_12930 [Bradyrhizobium sp. KB893862 SZCCT0404]|uniref:hypothetical protein n=1 Tax=Bradyrhizobium sp. KB893862 SZCCT0404 TaxID=2807672 RepID=UPI001BA54C7B|nr:hypothetical protein [Bradyrhizobium sp. KB893862 SZCCT0404]MBR1174866.1 hypothetical protein [Bradyrhizobium sp. KB893862 SZCCT0404]